MIRHQHGNDYLLFTQDDHASLSGQLAGHFGNLRFAAPQPRQAVLDAITLHDRGWPLHDQEPTLNEAGLPLHVFEVPIHVAVPVWSESVRIACEKDRYTGLLVSLHVLTLSAMAYHHFGDPEHRPRHARELFELNKFQQNQIEVQEQIRGEMGLRSDMALQLGLAPLRTSAEEDQLRFNYQVLRAMDQISLALLCTGRPFSTIEELSSRPGVEPMDLRLNYREGWELGVNPWPFDVERIEINVPFRRVPARAYGSVDEFREVYSAAPVEVQEVRVRL